MKRLLMHQDGRLKTGRVALLIFVLLLAGGGFLFKASRRIDTALVAVKHVFEPPAVEAVEKEEVQEVQEVQEVVEAVKEQAVEKPAPESVVEEEVMEQEEPVQVAEAPAQQEQAELTKEPVQPAPEPSSSLQPLAPNSEIAHNQEPRTLNLEPAFNPEPRTPNAELTLASEPYMKLLQAWRGSGSEEEGKPQIPLRVENLRETYTLFQMKVVAVNVRGQIFDLADGSRLPSAALDDYSATVFSVESPWAQWGEALKSAKFRPGEPVQVRYAMYPFVKNAIYARSRQAFEWCKSKGALSGDTQPEQVDVLGRTYVINREGGGRFGVFVPASLNAPDGRTIAIPPEAFAGQADVEALRQSGVW